MPPITVAPFTARLRAHGSYNGSEEWVNTLYVRSPIDEEPTLGQMAAWADHVQAYFAGRAATRANNWAYLGCDYRSMHAENRPTFHDTDAEVGASTVEALPPQIALVATFVADVEPEKPRLGRWFLNGFTEAALNDGRVLTAVRDAEAVAMRTFLQAIRDLPDSGFPVVVGYPAPGGFASTEISRVRVGDVWDTQRRRREGLVESYFTTISLT